MTPVYADHHATTPLSDEALEAMRPWLSAPANASSIHAFGRAARRALEEAREAVALSIGAEPSEIAFTSGGTESDNLAVRGGALAVREKDPARRRIVISAAEHPAVREAAVALQTEGLVVDEVPCGASGVPATSGVIAALSRETALVSLVLANNETGAINRDLGVAAERARAQGALIHTDAVQAIGKIPVDVRALGVDLLSLTAHKFGGPKGAGALYVRRGARVLPLFLGGGQEKGRRPGTENVPAIVGLGAAIRAAVSRLPAESARLGALRDRFESGLAAAGIPVRLNVAEGPPGSRLPTVTSATFPGADGETLLVALDLEGVAVSTGSACSTGTTKPSRVLRALGLSEADARSTLRFSFGRTTTEEEIERLLEVVPAVVWRVRGATVSTRA